MLLALIVCDSYISIITYRAEYQRKVAPLLCDFVPLRLLLGFDIMRRMTTSNDSHTHTRRIGRTIAGAIIALLVLGGLLALDLANRGLFWQFAWERTGEEEPVAQIRGLVQWTVGQFRAPLDLDPMVAIDHTNVNPYGVNTFWEQEVETAKIEAQAQMIADAGYRWIRQQFVWEDIEVDGRGQFTDSRNDLDGDGQPDTIDAWLKYDRIVDTAERYGLQIQGRLDNPPDWSRSDPEIGDFGPPDDLQDFVNFAVAVAERYQGRVTHFQVWNEPNLGFEWGERPVDPERYTELLCRTYDALKAVDSDIVVITGALAPTVDLSGYNLDDFIFLQRMYNAGAADCFDVLSMQGYGLFSGPTDERRHPTRINIAHNLYIRDMMVRNGDAHKPIWISEAAWNAEPSLEEFPGEIIGRGVFGRVTQDQAAEYLPIYYERAQREWPWIGVVNTWFFTRASDAERNQAFYYFRMVEPDYTPDRDPPFTPLPVYESMRDFINSETPTLYRGVHQAANHWAIGFIENGAVTFTAHGTDLRLTWRGAASLDVALGGATLALDGVLGAENTYTASLELSSTLPETRTLTLNAADDFTLETVTVIDRGTSNILPYAVAGFVAVLMLLLAIVDGLRSRGR